MESTEFDNRLPRSPLPPTANNFLIGSVLDLDTFNVFDARESLRWEDVLTASYKGGALLAAS